MLTQERKFKSPISLRPILPPFLHTAPPPPNEVIPAPGDK